MQTITTSRLSGSPFTPDDYAILCQLHQDPRVMATLGGVRSEERTQQFLDEKIAHREKYGFGYWMFRDTKNGHFIGRGGIQHVLINGKPEIEIGYTVCFEKWGNGFATEIAEALLARCFTELNLDDIVCFTLTTNKASEAVMRKVGFRFAQEFEHNGQPHLLYRMNQSEYKSRL